MSYISTQQIKQILAIWNPTKENTHHMDLFKRWKDLLDNNDSLITIPKGPTITVYERMVWEVWMPVIRRSISNWNVKDSDPVIGEWYSPTLIDL